MSFLLWLLSLAIDDCCCCDCAFEDRVGGGDLDEDAWELEVVSTGSDAAVVPSCFRFVDDFILCSRTVDALRCVIVLDGSAGDERAAKKAVDQCVASRKGKRRDREWRQEVSRDIGVRQGTLAASAFRQHRNVSAARRREMRNS